MYKDLKNNIINTSYQLFMENGYDQTTVNDICKACSITKTTFYRYIDSKEELKKELERVISREINLKEKYEKTLNYVSNFKYSNLIEKLGERIR